MYSITVMHTCGSANILSISLTVAGYSNPRLLRLLPLLFMIWRWRQIRKVGVRVRGVSDDYGIGLEVYQHTCTSISLAIGGSIFI